MVSLRNRKKVNQKLALMNEFIKLLETNKFQEVVVKNLCKKLELSETTFYNYFPKKIDVLRFFKRVVFF